jgi:hypothetical protein
VPSRRQIVAPPGAREIAMAMSESLPRVRVQVTADGDGLASAGEKSGREGENSRTAAAKSRISGSHQRRTAALWHGREARLRG